MSKLDELPEPLKAQLNAALAEREPEGPKEPQQSKEPKEPKDSRVVPMDTEDRLRVENIGLKETLLKLRTDMANEAINHARQELKTSLAEKYGLADTQGFEINSSTGTISIHA